MSYPIEHPVDVVVMAAGKGTRMKSRLPKVLQRLAGVALVQHVLNTAAQLNARSAVVITGHGAEQVESVVLAPGQALAVQCVRQEPQLGTGHAVQQALPVLGDDGVVVILSGDVPLTQANTLQALIALCAGHRLALLTIDFADPTGYGRIVRGVQGQDQTDAVQAIVEHKDASDAQRQIQEVYSGIMAVPAQRLKNWLGRIGNQNAQGEYYLTDVVKLAVADGVPVVAHKIADPLQVAGINSPVQLAELERAHQLGQAQHWMAQGVRLLDPARFDLRGQLDCAQDVEIDVNCIFEGRVVLGEGVKIGANCVIANCNIEAGAVIQPFTHIDGEALGVTVGQDARIGPFARLRPGAQLAADVHIGNFVEVKNATMAKGAKANHLAYLGDATVGERVNYGAGSITANYDGANKHRTVIEADVHIGSNCVLVAPVTIGAGGTVGGGSTITKSTEPGVLTTARGKQVSMNQWKRPEKTPSTPKR
jgi:bifunctional UDP-N-acetylglucosamine pyrophosphorylase/glucosamine-1-phosphate N-acetyltransferase